MKRFVLAMLCGALLLPASAQADVASASLTDTEGDAVGTVRLTDSPNGVLVAVDQHDLPGGELGFHIHGTGSCTPDFAAAAGHFNPDGSEHRAPNPG